LELIHSTAQEAAHADVELLSTHRGMHMRGVAGQQDMSVTIGDGLASHVGEAGDRGGIVDSVVGSVYGSERLFLDMIFSWKISPSGSNLLS
jgi:hypothetical protein